jgi:hypothetical protein
MMRHHTIGETRNGPVPSATARRSDSEHTLFVSIDDLNRATWPMIDLTKPWSVLLVVINRRLRLPA